MNIEDYLEADRQWSRHLRIAHAKYRMGLAQSPEERKFFLEIVKSNANTKLEITSPIGFGYVSP